MKLNISILRNNISNSNFCCQLLLANAHNTSRTYIQNIIEKNLNVTFETEDTDTVVPTLGLL